LKKSRARRDEGRSGRRFQIRRALVLGDIFTNTIGAFQTSSFRFKEAQALADQGLSVVAVSPFGRHVGSALRDFVSNIWPARKEVNNVYCLFPPNIRAPLVGSALSFISAIPFLIVLRIFFAPDVVYATSVQHGAIGAILKPIYRSKLIVNYGDPEFERIEGPKRILLTVSEALALTPKRTDAVIYLDEGIADHIKKNFSPIRSFFLPPNGYDAAEEHEPSMTEIEDLKAGLGLEGCFTAVYAGQLTGRPYRLDLLPGTAQELTRRGKPVKFLIVGSGPFSEELKRRIETDHLEGQFLFTGAVSPRKVASYLRLGSLGLQLLDDMCMGTKVITYMLNGLPVASTGKWYEKYRPDSDSLLKNGENCLLLPPDSTKLADVIEQLYDSPEKGRRMAVNAYEAVKKYTWRYHAERILGASEALTGTS